MNRCLAALIAVLIALSPAQAAAANLGAAVRGAHTAPTGMAGVGAGLTALRIGMMSTSRGAALTPTLGGMLPGVSLQTLIPLSFSAANVQLAPAETAAAAPSGLFFAATANSELITVERRTATTPKTAASPSSIKRQTAANKGFHRVVTGLRRALSLERTGAAFDGSRRAPGLGIVAGGEIESDVPLDRRPVQPGNTEVARLTWQRTQLPGAGSIHPLSSMFGRQSVRPIALPGNPQDAAGVEAALRTLIAENPNSFGGITPEQLETVLFNKVAGRQGLGDAVYVNFRQTHNTLSIDGTYLDFTVKLIDGEAILVASTAQLYPTLEVDTFGRLSEAEALERAFERLGRPTGSYDDLHKIGKRIMHLEGRWRSVYLAVSESKSLMAAVDVNTGEAYAWDARHTAETAAGGQVSGRGYEFDPANSTELDVMPLGHTKLTTSDGRTLWTDADGAFTLDGDKTVTVTAKLEGRWVKIRDQGGKRLSVAMEVQPGEQVTLMFNPEGMDENEIAQINAYRHVNVVHDWIKAVGIDTEEIDISLPVKPNARRDCNAYYTPWSPSLNFFSSSARCINTAYDTVVYHEYGHFVDDVIGGIVNGALSEGWGDIIGMFITGQPILGEGFLKNRERHYIRHGENDYQYRGRDEVHKQGQAWMGFAWKLRANLVRASGEAGARIAEQLMMPVLFANVRNIPAAIEAVLLRDVGDDGNAAHWEEISAAAQAHGIELTRPSPGGATATRVLSERTWIQRLSDLAFGWTRR